MKNSGYLLRLAAAGYVLTIWGLYLAAGVSAVLIAIGATCMCCAAVLAQQSNSAE